MSLELFQKKFQKKSDIMVIAHQGASREAPGNTLRAFELAVDSGAEMIEFDIHKTLDNHVVVIHDPTTERVSDRNIRVKKSTLEQVREVTLKDGLKIPTLEEVFAQFKGKLYFQIEICQKKMTTEVFTLIDKYDVYDQCLFSSFLHDELPKYRISKKPILIALLNDTSNQLVKNTLEMGMDGIHPKYTIVTPELVKDAHENNLFVNTYTADAPEDWEYLINCGVDGIITNNPRKLHKFLNSR